MNTEIDHQISKEEIDWVRNKHEGIHKAARRMLKEAMEIGQWLNEAAVRMNIKLGQGKSNPEWRLWLRATFPEIHPKADRTYRRLAGGYDYLQDKYNFGREGEVELTIQEAMRLLTQRDREAKEKEEPDQPLAEFEEPLQILADQLKAYVYQQFQLKYLEEQIKFRIKNAKLGRKQIRQAIEWACREHAEIKDIVLGAFL